MKKIISLIIFVGLISAGSAQNKKLKITYGSWGNKYLYGDQKVSKSEFKTYLASADPLLASQFSSGSSKMGFSNVLGFAGGFMLGWNLGDLITGRSKKFTLGGIGLGLIAIGIPISSSGKKKMNSSVALYNLKYADN